jgi:hypothetical protein
MKKGGGSDVLCITTLLDIILYMFFFIQSPCLIDMILLYMQYLPY